MVKGANEGEGEPVILQLELEDATVADACQMVFQQTEAQYYITLEARNRRVGRLSIRNMRLSEVLDYIVKPTGLYWWRDKSGVFIISDKPPAEEPLQKPQVGKPEKPQEPEVVEEPIKPSHVAPPVVEQESEPPVLPRLVTSEELKERIQQEQPPRYIRRYKAQVLGCTSCCANARGTRIGPFTNGFNSTSFG